MAYAMIPRYRGTDTLASWRDADRFAGEFFGWSRVGRSQLVGETRRAFVPQIDVSCSDETYSVTAELPGLTQEDFEVEVEDINGRSASDGLEIVAYPDPRNE